MGPVPVLCLAAVAGLWSSPDAPRPIDGDALGDRPDVAGWLRALDAAATADPEAGRRGLHGRLESQLVEGERALVVAEGADGWLGVVCPEQPSSRDPRGYPGWVRAAHLDRVHTAGDVAPAQIAPGASNGQFLAAARAYAGTTYLWGGMTAYGVDCSGLVHMAARSLGILLPRDAHDQRGAAEAVEVAEAEPGDLYFFAHPGTSVHHVGIVTAPGVMLHAPQTGAVVVEEPLSDERRATLVGAGRIPGIRCGACPAM